jgi:uncharacterized membrane protein YfcA
VQPVASLRFLKSARFALRSALGLTIGGVFGVIIAAFVVKQLPITALRWLVIVVVIYAASLMLRSTRRSKR